MTTFDLISYLSLLRDICSGYLRCQLASASRSLQPALGPFHASIKGIQHANSIKDGKDNGPLRDIDHSEQRFEQYGTCAPRRRNPDEHLRSSRPPYTFQEAREEAVPGRSRRATTWEPQSEVGDWDHQARLSRYGTGVEESKRRVRR